MMDGHVGGIMSHDFCAAGYFGVPELDNTVQVAPIA
jgi:hypothetical protein